VLQQAIVSHQREDLVSTPTNMMGEKTMLLLISLALSTFLPGATAFVPLQSPRRSNGALQGLVSNVMMTMTLMDELCATHQESIS
jgi:hypothetical protein